MSQECGMQICSIDMLRTTKPVKKHYDLSYTMDNQGDKSLVLQPAIISPLRKLLKM
jgi:hypothetical protein